jgi:hypothetical protein
VGQGAAEPIEPPHYQHVALCRIGKRLGQLGLIGAETAHPVFKEVPAIDASLEHRSAVPASGPWSTPARSRSALCQNPLSLCFGKKNFGRGF